MTLSDSIKRLVVSDSSTPPPRGSTPSSFRMTKQQADPPMAFPKRTKSNADIFERDIVVDPPQDSSPNMEMDPLSNQIPNIATLSSSFSSNNTPFPTQREIPVALPRHLFSEDYTSPILDSNVELIANGDFDRIDVVQVPHRQASLGLLQTCCSRSSHTSLPSSPRLSISRKYSNSSSLTKLNTRPSFQVESNDSLIPPCTCTQIDQPTSSPRKSIPFYSYSDLVNFERMSHMSPTSSSNTNTAIGSPLSDSDFNNNQQGNDIGEFQLNDYNDSCNPNCPRHHRLQRRPTVQQGANNETEFTIDEQLEAPDAKIPIPTAFDPSSHSTNSVVNDDKNNSDNESILIWLPESEQTTGSNTTLQRRRSVVEDLASVKSTTTNNSYFEDELDSEIGEPLVNVCSAKDFIRTKSRELRKSFVDNDTNSKRFPISQ